VAEAVDKFDLWLTSSSVWSSPCVTDAVDVVTGLQSWETSMPERARCSVYWLTPSLTMAAATRVRNFSAINTRWSLDGRAASATTSLVLTAVVLLWTSQSMEVLTGSRSVRNQARWILRMYWILAAVPSGQDLMGPRPKSSTQGWPI